MGLVLISNYFRLILYPGFITLWKINNKNYFEYQVVEIFNSFCLKRWKGASACSSYFFSLKTGEIGTRKLRRSQGTLGLISRLENLPEPPHCAGPRASWWRWNTNCTETPQDAPSQSAAHGISSHRAVPMANPPNLSVSPDTPWPAADVRHGQVYRAGCEHKQTSFSHTSDEPGAM